MAQPIYLDYNGTTPHAPEVVQAMRPYLEQEFGNPSSNHWYGIGPKRAVAKARRQVASLLRCDPEEIIFTSGGTESNNHAIRGVAMALREKGNHIITCAIEHPAVLEVCRATAGNIASMLQDVLKERLTEVDFINGAIVREGEVRGIPTPVNFVLTHLVKTIQMTYQERL